MFATLGDNIRVSWSREGTLGLGWNFCRVPQAEVVVVAGGSVLPWLGRGDGHSSLPAAGTGTPESPWMCTLSCGDAEDEERNTILGAGKAAGAEGVFAND